MYTANILLQVKVIITMLLIFIYDVMLVHAGLNIRSLILSIDISDDVRRIMTTVFILLLFSHKLFACVFTLSLLCFCIPHFSSCWSYQCIISEWTTKTVLCDEHYQIFLYMFALPEEITSWIKMVQPLTSVGQSWAVTQQANAVRWCWTLPHLMLWCHKRGQRSRPGRLLVTSTD